MNLIQPENCSISAFFIFQLPTSTKNGNQILVGWILRQLYCKSSIPFISCETWNSFDVVCFDLDHITKLIKFDFRFYY
jgi:hypothetical protein